MLAGQIFQREIRHRRLVCCCQHSGSFVERENSNLTIHFLRFASLGDRIVKAVPTSEEG